MELKSKLMIYRHLIAVMNYIFKYFITAGILLFLSTAGHSQINSSHPCVAMKKSEIGLVKKGIGKLPLFDKSFEVLKSSIDKEIAQKIDVPVPKDPAGGYTHNKHKDNYLNMYGAGLLWQLTGNEKYAVFVKEMLLKYADLYPTLGLHPIKKSSAPGRLFWQMLNDAVWMVYTSQAYDCIYDYLNPDERQKIEKDLMIPYADFLSIGTPKVFNRIHNHGVWSVAAVGMAGFAMNNEVLINRALNGIEEPNSTKKYGFFTQIDELFSPDGYYTEGPYYQRYALLPFVLFAQAIENNKPDLKIFEYRNQILRKAVITTLQLTNKTGNFFPFNDALKSMSYLAPELISAVDIIYNQFPTDNSLLSIAKEQDNVLISPAGYHVAKDISLNKTKAFEWKSNEFRDGARGDQGGIGILRSEQEKEEQCILMKYASHGLDHGHFDQLGIMYYHNADEILQDYGAARFVNIFYKQGGRYLPENDTWARQTIAHNTLVVDSTSHFGGSIREAEKFHAEPWFFDASNPALKIMSAKENNAYKGVKMQRTVALFNEKRLSANSIILDILRVESDNEHTYDLPYYYQGQFMYTNIDYTASVKELKAMGNDNGYEHLWIEALGNPKDSGFQFTWMNNNQFYTIHSAVNLNTAVYFTRIGASDPEFNLRRETGLIIRENKAKNHVFASTIESHGKSNPLTELTDDLNSHVKQLKILIDNNDFTAIEIIGTTDNKFILAIANSDNNREKQHQLKISGIDYNWKGAYYLFNKNENNGKQKE